MTTLPVRAGDLPRNLLISALAQAASAVSAFVRLYVEVYIEALNQAHEVQKRYPFSVV